MTIKHIAFWSYEKRRTSFFRFSEK